MTGPVFKYFGEVIPSAFGDILPPDEEWLGRQPPEEVLLPELAILDSHHHLWDHPGYRYQVAEYAADVNTGHNVTASIYVESHAQYREDGPEPLKPVGETEFAAQQHAEGAGDEHGPTQTAAGIIGFADVTLGDDVREVLEAHVTAGDGHFKGIRVPAAWDPNEEVRNGQAGDRPGVLLEPQVRKGLTVLQDMSLVLECWVFFHQLGEVAEIADALPGLTIVIDHCGGAMAFGPYAHDRKEHHAAWEAAIRDLAQRPNVRCKLGGLMARIDTFDYIHAETPPTSEHLADCWREWIEPCIDAFGAERAMFESNFPVDKIGVPYATLWNTFKRLTEGVSDDERTALFSGTAARAYSLDVR